MKLNRSCYLLFVICLISLTGCSKKSPPPPTSSEAHQKLIKICKEEFKENITLKDVGKTLWIYFPMKENMFEIKASRPSEEENKDPKTKQVVRFIDGSFKDESFHIKYDIISNKIYSKSYGYASSYSEIYQRKQRQIFDAFSRAYLEANPGPEFIVFVIADITNGVESENILYFKDLKESLTVSPEEYLKRVVSDLRGSLDIINDTTGTHLKYLEITMPNFLAKQIINRINFKYQRSSFPPENDPVTEIKSILSETFQAYEFRDYQSVELEDLDKLKTTTILRTELN